MDEQTLRQHIKIYLDGAPIHLRGRWMVKLFEGMFPDMFPVPPVIGFDVEMKFPDGTVTPDEANAIAKSIRDATKLVTKGSCAIHRAKVLGAMDLPFGGIKHADVIRRVEDAKHGDRGVSENK